MLHAKLSPSGAARRVVCPGSRALEERYPETEDSSHSREGHAAHWVAASRLKRENIDLIAPNGERVTDAMIDGAQMLYESVSEVAVRLGFPMLHIELPVNISSIHPDCWGTPDVWLAKDREVHLWDYKFGHGYVEVFENWQLLEYAAGILQLHPADTVTFYIVQPRCYDRRGPIRTWTVDFKRLDGYFAYLRARETIASRDDAQCEVSPQCKNCRAKHACHALQQFGGHMVDVAASNVPLELTPAEIGVELRTLRRAMASLEGRVLGLEEQAKAMISRGEFVPGFKMEASGGREKWFKTPDEIIMLGELMGINLAKPQETITPAQARKLGLDEAIIKSYAKTYSGALKLVESDDARKIFGGE